MAKHIAQSERLWLEPLTVEDHLEGYHQLNTDERVVKWSSYTGPRETIEHSKELLLHRQPSDEQPFKEMYAVMLRPTTPNGQAKFIGSLGITRLTDDGTGADVGYGILPDHWGKGYAPEALKMFCDYYWTSERRVQKDSLGAGTEPHNGPSARVLEKAGFTRGKTIEKAFQAPNLVTKELEWRSAIEWHLERPRA